MNLLLGVTHTPVNRDGMDPLLYTGGAGIVELPEELGPKPVEARAVGGVERQRTIRIFIRSLSSEACWLS